MLKAASTATRAPRGTKPVSQAFFTALETVPEASRSAVAKAALTMIRDEMKTRRDKEKLAAAKEKEKARAAAPAKATPAKTTPVKAAQAKPQRAAKAAAPAENGSASPKRRGRKTTAQPAEG